MNIPRCRYVLADRAYNRGSIGFFVSMTEINHQLNDGALSGTCGAELHKVYYFIQRILTCLPHKRH